MDEQNIVGLQCMVWYNNNRAEEMCWFKRKQSSFQWQKLKNIGLANFLSKYICFLESFNLLTLSQKLQILNAWKNNFGEYCASKLIYFLFVS